LLIEADRLRQQLKKRQAQRPRNSAKIARRSARVLHSPIVSIELITTLANGCGEHNYWFPFPQESVQLPEHFNFTAI
jgi:hypothetical protein